MSKYRGRSLKHTEHIAKYWCWTRLQSAGARHLFETENYQRYREQFWGRQTMGGDFGDKGGERNQNAEGLHDRFLPRDTDKDLGQLRLNTLR